MNMRSSPNACDETAEFHSLAGRLTVRGPSPNDQVGRGRSVSALLNHKHFGGLAYDGFMIHALAVRMRSAQLAQAARSRILAEMQSC